MNQPIEVTQADIDAGKPRTVCYSPLGLALERTYADGRHYDVWPDGVIVAGSRRMRLSTRALSAFRRFYHGKPIQPFRFHPWIES